ncbi:hypothetical protein Bpfe_029538 [Biomphalaria pfeifferi]|uniref:Uncharacterized protein n=1 Tax=Biomphalaria pfeifferi TaxID=112525 RepID=A0AAD8ARG3_BIOPF|nr:hypothetical protein Bpfe_029538 [Biomphalaria pfeifferi]
MTPMNSPCHKQLPGEAVVVPLQNTKSRGRTIVPCRWLPLDRSPRGRNCPNELWVREGDSEMAISIEESEKMEVDLAKVEIAEPGIGGNGPTFTKPSHVTIQMSMPMSIKDISLGP